MAEGSIMKESHGWEWKISEIYIYVATYCAIMIVSLGRSDMDYRECRSCVNTIGRFGYIYPENEDPHIREGR